MLVEQLSSLGDDLAAFEPWSLTGAELRGLAEALQHARTAVDAALSRVAGTAEGMGLPREEGASSTSAWLAQVTGIHRGEAGRLVRLSRAEGVDASRAAWAAGMLGTDKAAVVIKAVGDLPDWLDEEPRRIAEAYLLDQARTMGLDDLRREANKVLERIDPIGADEELGRQVRAEEERAWKATSLKISRRGDGTSRLVSVLPDADMDTLRAAFEGIIAPRRSGANAIKHDMSAGDWNALPRDVRMGHAFAELLTHLPTEALPQAGGLAATVAVMVDLDDLAQGHGTAQTTSGTMISGARAQRLACNAHLVALYLDSDSRVVDHGMTRRLYDRHQRLVLAARDGGCVWAGCDRPPAWCEAHHIDFWSEGGPTDLSNAALVCHFHHFLLHEGAWTAVMADDGVVEIIPPRSVDPTRTPRRHARFKQRAPNAA